MIYNTGNEAFSPILDKVLEFLDGESHNLAIDLLLLCCTIKDGTRIRDWSKISLRMTEVIRSTGLHSRESYVLAATIIARANTISSKAFPKTVFEFISKQKSRKVGFLCEIVGRLNEAAFQTFVLEEYAKYISHTEEEEFQGIMLAIIALRQKGLLQAPEAKGDGDGRLNNHIVSKKSKFIHWLQSRLSEEIQGNSLLLWRDLQVLEILGLRVPEMRKVISELLQSACSSDDISKPGIIGAAVSLLANEGSSSITEILHPIKGQLDDLQADLGFLEGLEMLIKAKARFDLHIPQSLIKSTLMETDILNQTSLTLQTNLSNPSHLIRSATLRILQLLAPTAKSSPEALIRAMLEIETTPRTVENVRSTSLAMRKLPMLSSVEYDTMLAHFCFGLLTINFAPLWNDACSVLKVISDRSGEIVWKLAFERLNIESNGEMTSTRDLQRPNSETVENFTDKLWQSVDRSPDDALRFLFEQSLERNRVDGNISPRSQSLRALLEVPQLAEKHSRDLVPIFLALEAPSDEPPLHWPRKDRLALMTLFTKFTKPRALYKTDFVRSTLYTLLHNGDSKIQTLALDAILTWNEVELVTYKENLHNLLDDKKFREELTRLVDVDANDSPVQDAHRKALMQVALRILFGNALVRHGSGETKRAAILSALVNLKEDEKAIFLKLVLSPFQENHGAIHREGSEFQLEEEKVSIVVDDRKMAGFIAMLQHLVKALGGTLEPFLPDLLEGLVICMWNSRLAPAAEEDVVEDSDGEISLELQNTKTKVSRTVRKGAMKVLNMLIDACPEFDWWPYVFLMFEKFISPKMHSLVDENIQSPSIILQFFETLSEHKETVRLLSQLSEHVLPNILRCVGNSDASVKVFDAVFRIISNIFKFSELDEESHSLKDDIILPNLTDILEHITHVFTNDRFQHIPSNKDSLDLVTDVLRSSAPLAKTAEHAERLIEPLLSLSVKPGRMINEKTKAGIVESVLNLLPLCDDFTPNSPTFERRLQSISRLFSILNNRTARIYLCQLIHVFAEADPSLHEIAEVVTDLNAYDSRRLDTPDFDRRLAAYGRLNEEMYQSLTSYAWAPIVYNLLYYVQDMEEMSLRTGAAFGLQRFFTIAGKNQLSTEYTQLLSHAVFPAIKKGIKNPNELVRKEYVGVLDSLVKQCGDWQPISDLKVLLFEGDEEANFFNNIYHIQQHRQLRAITRLCNVAAGGALRSTNVEEIFIPMLESFSLKSDEEAQNVAAEAPKAIGVLSGALGWKAYRQLVKRYLSMLKSGHEKERVVVRTLCSVVEMAGKVAESRKLRMQNLDSTGESDIPEGKKDLDQMDDFLIRAVVEEFYPPMLQYLHHHEESTLSLRVPVAIALVKVLKALPEQYLAQKLPAILTDVSHVLRSRSQEDRDTCRKTLNEIMALLGPKFFSFILRELKTALSRGYQLHVLGYTVHSLLAHISTKHGDLDECVKDIVDVLIGDIFGVTGTEKESEGYTTSMKEIKTSKSYDSFEILTRITPTESLNLFLQPLKTFLYELATAKEIRKMVEILRRIELGILRSEEADPSKVFDFCLSYFKNIQSEAISVSQVKEALSTNQFIVDLKFKRKYEVNHFKANAPIMLRFALNTLAALFKKHETLLNEQRISELIPVLGDCLMSDTDDLRIASLRLLGRMIAQPVPAIEEGVDVFVDCAVEFVKESPVTKSELCQASIKFLSLLIRDRKSFVPPENVVMYVFERIRPDLEEPDRQGVSFSFIRAVLFRKVVISEVYDMMSDIARIMVTNQSRSVRDTARALYLQFLMDYPQGRDRLKKQISFLIKNLQYEHDTGRQSVMEVLHQVISKFGDELLQPILLDIFVGLLLPLANDENHTCREMASRLIQATIENADEERSKAIRTMLRTWANQNDKPALLKASLHVYSILLEHGTSGDDDLTLCVDCVNDIILRSKEDGNRSKALWDVTEQALHLVGRLMKRAPSKVFLSEKAELWLAMQPILLCGHLGVRLVAAQLSGSLFGRAESVGDGQLRIDNLFIDVSDLIGFARQFLEQIKNSDSTAEICLQAVKNLIFLGRHFYKMHSLLPQSKKSPEGEIESKPCLTWLISRVAAEVRYEHAVAEVSSILISALISSILAGPGSCLHNGWWQWSLLWSRMIFLMRRNL